MPTRKKPGLPSDQIERILALMSNDLSAGSPEERAAVSERIADEALDLARRIMGQLEEVTGLWQAREEQASQIINNLIGDAKSNYRTFRRMQSKETERWLARHRGGKEAAKVHRDLIRARNEMILVDAGKLKANGRQPRELASILGHKHGLSATQVRTILGPIRAQKKGK